MIVIGSNSNFRFEHLDLADWDLSSVKVVIVLYWKISSVEVIVWGTMSLFEAGEFLSHLHLTLHDSTKVPSGEHTVVWNPMVVSMRFIIMIMLEVSGI